MAIAADLATRIRGGELPPGSALPPQRELSQTYGVTLATLNLWHVSGHYGAATAARALPFASLLVPACT